MIDTIKLTLPKGMFMLTDKNLFQRGITNAGRGYSILVQNPTKSELKRGIYKPRLAITNRFNTTGRSELTLSIELSLPKLVYGNNFDELKDSDFGAVADLLQKALKTMGVKVFRELLIRAPVSSVHYSKNIILTDGTTPHYIISKIKEANVSLALDVNQTDYRNEGYSYKWHANSYEVAFYDKLKELETAKKTIGRAIEKDNAIQFGLFDQFDKRKPFEVLRMEVRLNKMQKIRHVFGKLDINFTNELPFEELFKKDIAQKVLVYYMNEVKAKRPKILDYKSKDIKATLADIAINNPKMTPAKIFQTLGIKLALDAVPTREIRAILGKTKKHYWYRLNSEMEKVNLPATTDVFGVLDNALNKFETVKTVDFNGALINNDKYK